MKKENRLRYILPENRTVRIVLAVFFWLLAAACAGCIFWLSSRDGNQSKDMSDNVRGILAKILGSPLGSFIVRKFAHFFEYTARLFTQTGKFQKPDVIMATSVHPFTCVAGILIAKKYHCPCVVEIADLWPLTLVE